MYNISHNVVFVGLVFSSPHSLHGEKLSPSSSSSSVVVAIPPPPPLPLSPSLFREIPKRQQQKWKHAWSSGSLLGWR